MCQVSVDIAAVSSVIFVAPKARARYNQRRGVAYVAHETLREAFLKKRSPNQSW